MNVASDKLNSFPHHIFNYFKFKKGNQMHFKRKASQLLSLCVCSTILPLNVAYAASLEKLSIEGLMKSNPTFSASYLNDTSESALSNLLGLPSNESVSSIKTVTDIAGNTHVRYQQLYQGLPIWGQNVLAHSKGKSLYRITGALLRGIEKDLGDIDTQAGISPEEALESARQWLRDQSESPSTHLSFSNENAEKVIYQGSGQAMVVYAVSYFSTIAGQPTRPYFFVDAVSGDVIKQWEGLTYAEAEATGPGGNLRTGEYHYGTDFPALQITEIDGTCTMENPNVKTVDLNHVEDQDDVLVTAFSFPCFENIYKAINGAFSPINDGHFFGTTVFDMYNNWYGESPIPFQLVMRLHYGSNSRGAFWNGVTMNFGDGNNEAYPAISLDIAAHEASHGFTQFNSDLIYREQSGGINEAFSDMAGEAAEFFMRGSNDWLVGADTTKEEGAALRYFEDPTLDGVSIGHVDNYFPGMDVHYSSGVFNRAFYVISNSVGWDIKKAFDIFLLANQSYWTAGTDFSDGACGVLQATRDLGYDVNIPTYAFYSVGAICPDSFLDDDEDGMDDSWEVLNGLDQTTPADAGEDPDVDGLNNLAEYELRADPHNPDTDSDTLSDGDEVNIHGTSPVLSDTDGDSMRDDWELRHDLNPRSNTDSDLDFDGDTFENYIEHALDTDPNDSASFPIVTLEFSESFETGIPSLWIMPADANAFWKTSTAFALDGTQSLKSDVISNFEKSAIEFSKLFAAGDLSFDYKVSSEIPFDSLQVMIDDEIVFSMSGNVVSSATIPVSEGFHRIQFLYAKDESFAANMDTAWIDNVVFVALVISDVDGDGMPTAWELEKGLKPNDPTDAAIDMDQDGLTNLEEYETGTEPGIADTDNDGLVDGDEINIYFTNPLEGNVDLALAVTPRDESDDAVISFDLVVSNAGVATATNVNIRFTMPEGVTLNSFTPVDGLSCDVQPDSLICDANELVSGENIIMNIVLDTADSGTGYDFFFFVSSDEVDYDGENNYKEINAKGGSLNVFILMLLSAVGLLRNQRKRM